MSIYYRPTVDLLNSAELTYNNMRRYYEHFSVGWDASTIFEQILGLENYDIVHDNNLVGVLRLSFEGGEFWLRDVQVIEKFQNKGIGASALEETRSRALKFGANLIKLKVFKISPAHHLYRRNGFEIYEEDGKFYYMEKQIS